jgi:hypothetical protein
MPDSVGLRESALLDTVPCMATNEKPQVEVPADQAPSYQLELEDITVGDSSTPPGTAATPSSSGSARAR